jgi:hypothetical protein
MDRHVGARSCLRRRGLVIQRITAQNRTVGHAKPEEQLWRILAVTREEVAALARRVLPAHPFRRSRHRYSPITPSIIICRPPTISTTIINGAQPCTGSPRFRRMMRIINA